VSQFSKYLFTTKTLNVTRYHTLIQLLSAFFMMFKQCTGIRAISKRFTFYLCMEYNLPIHESLSMVQFKRFKYSIVQSFIA